MKTEALCSAGSLRYPILFNFPTEEKGRPSVWSSWTCSLPFWYYSFDLWLSGKDLGNRIPSILILLIFRLSIDYSSELVSLKPQLSLMSRTFHPPSLLSLFFFLTQYKTPRPDSYIVIGGVINWLQDGFSDCGGFFTTGHMMCCEFSRIFHLQ